MDTPTRRPFTGSCHCGDTQYVLFLTMPHDQIPIGANQRRSPPGVQNFYRCNCTLCHKAGLLHVRPLSPPDDFLILAPQDPLSDMGDYMVPKGSTHWFFCKTCGMRCFSLRGEGESIELDVADAGLQEVTEKLESKGLARDGKIRAWKLKKEGWNGYLSINGHSLDAGQEGLDLREWKEKGWLLYIDCLEPLGEGRGERPRYERPHEGGTY